jgi:hypothetical protein
MAPCWTLLFGLYLGDRPRKGGSSSIPCGRRPLIGSLEDCPLEDNPRRGSRNFPLFDPLVPMVALGIVPSSRGSGGPSSPRLLPSPLGKEVGSFLARGLRLRLRLWLRPQLLLRFAVGEAAAPVGRVILAANG